MLDMMKRHEIQVLRRAGVKQSEVAKLVGVSERTVRDVEQEPRVVAIDDAAEHERRRLGRPSTVEPFRELVAGVLKKDPELLSVEILRRARLEGVHWR
jgi:hypothetical protein